jgi:hypothetical protein
VICGVLCAKYVIYVLIGRGGVVERKWEGDFDCFGVILDDKGKNNTIQRAGGEGYCYCSDS